MIHHVTKKLMIHESDSCFFAMKIIIIVWMIACWPKGGNRFDKSTVIISKIFFKLADKNSTNIIWSDLKSSKDVRRCVDDWLIDDDWWNKSIVINRKKLFSLANEKNTHTILLHYFIFIIIKTSFNIHRLQWFIQW